MASETSALQMRLQRFYLEKQSSTLQVDRALVFLNLSSFVMKEVARAAVGHSVNFTVAQLDNCFSHLDLCQSYQVSHVRHADLQSEWLIPTVPKVVEGFLK